MQLPNTLSAWDTPDFERVFKTEIESLGGDGLPLQAGLSRGSFATDKDLSVLVIRSSDEAGAIRVRAGVYFTGIITGCSCPDDPTPDEGQTEYCEMQFDIDKTTAEARVRVVPD